MRVHLDAERRYMAEISDHPLLSPDEELELSRCIEETEVELWERLLEGALSSRVQQLFLERGGAAQNISAVTARAADLDREIIRHLLRDVQASGDVRQQREVRNIQGGLAKADLLRGRFVRCNLRLVPSTIRRFGYHHNTRLAMADLIQEGNLGLIKAVPRFDYRRGHRFSTFAIWWIRHCVVDARQSLGDEVRLPAHVHTFASKVRQTRVSLRQEMQREPSLKEVARKLEVSKESIQAIEGNLLKYPESLPTSDTAGEDAGSSAFLASSDPLADKEVTARQEAVRIAIALEEIPAQLSQIIRRRFGLDNDSAETLAQIGDSLKLSRERIRQLEEKALEILRRKLRELTI